MSWWREIFFAPCPPAEDYPGETTLVGHVHGLFDELLLPNGARIVNVGVDVRGFAPATLDEVLYSSARSAGRYI